MVVYHRANTGSHELQKPPKATYVTPYLQKKQVFIPWDSQPLPLCAFWTLRLKFFSCPDPVPRSEEALCDDTPLCMQTVEVCQGRTCEQALAA